MLDAIYRGTKQFPGNEFLFENNECLSWLISIPAFPCHTNTTDIVTNTKKVNFAFPRIQPFGYKIVKI